MSLEKSCAVKNGPVKVPTVAAPPPVTTGFIPNKANASVPEPADVMEMVLDDPAVAEVMTSLPPTAETEAPVI